jgi:DNA-binding transcriptional LysR family regulator
MKLHHFSEVVSEVVAIAERGSIRAAARHLGVAQPALTRSLAELEHELKAPLFERRSRGVVATPLGEAFVRRATLVLQEIRRTREEVDQLRGAATGNVTVGLSIAAHMALLPSALRPFRARYPDVRLHIIEGFYPTLELGLRDATVDFYIGPRFRPRHHSRAEQGTSFRRKKNRALPHRPSAGSQKNFEGDPSRRLDHHVDHR